MLGRQLLRGALAAVASLAVMGCSTTPNEPAGTLGSPSAAASSAEATQTATASGPYAVGDRIKLDDEEFFAVVQVDPNVQATGLVKPATGKKWVAALVQIEGINPSGASYNPFFFKVRDSTGFEYNFSAFGKEPALQSSNDLKPGDKVSGWVTFEVPKAATGLILIYQAGFLSEPVQVSLG